MALIMLVACMAFEAIPLCPHVNDSTPSQVVLLMLVPNKSTVNIALQAIPIPFCSTNLFQCQDAEKRIWRLKTTMREPVREFTRANEIAEHIIRVDFDT